MINYDTPKGLSVLKKLGVLQIPYNDFYRGVMVNIVVDEMYHCDYTHEEKDRRQREYPPRILQRYPDILTPDLKDLSEWESNIYDNNVLSLRMLGGYFKMSYNPI